MQYFMNNSKILIFLFPLLLGRSAFSQDSVVVNSVSRFDYFLPIERSMFQRFEEKLSARDISFHTAFRTWRADEVRKVIAFDSLNRLPIKDCKFNRTWLGRKLRKEHLFTVDKDDFHFAVDPLFDVSVGRETQEKKNIF